MSLTFFLGSGTSIPAGIASTDEITQLVRSGRGVTRHTDGSYYVNDSAVTGDSTKHIVALINVLFAEIQDYYNDRRSHPVNYENCCYVAAQLCDAESGEFDNPAVQPLIEKLKQREDFRSLMATNDERLELFTETKHFIQDIVWRKVARQPSRLEYLHWLMDAALDVGAGSTQFFTLNHDTVLEQAFKKKNVAYCDGFGEAEGNIRFWEPSRLEEKHRIHVCKLHGSIDWFWFRSRRRVGIPMTDDLFDTPGRPELLVGTFNKMHQYTASVFADIHCHFHRCLRRTNLLVCCGYGFGDKGINTKLVEWINADSSNRLIIVHPDLCTLMGCSRGAVANHWQEWQRAGKMRAVEKRVEKVRWDEVKAALIESKSL